MNIAIQPAAEPAPATAAVPLATSEQPTIPPAPASVNPSYSPSTVALAPLPEQSSMAPPPPTLMPEIQSTPGADPTTVPSTNAPIVQTTPVRMMENSTSPVMTSSTVPLAPFPSDTSAQAQKGSANSFVVFNLSVYTIISILIVGLF